VVELVDGLVKRPVVQRAVKKVMPGVLHDEEDDDLESHGRPLGERDTVVHAEEGRDRVEEPDLRKFDSAVTQENQRSTLKLFPPRGQLLL